ncbi:hypothetical protein BH24CHL4_BH24CHL4_17060 [soil metagenome]
MERTNRATGLCATHARPRRREVLVSSLHFPHSTVTQASANYLPIYRTLMRQAEQCESGDCLTRILNSDVRNRLWTNYEKLDQAIEDANPAKFESATSSTGAGAQGVLTAAWSSKTLRAVARTHQLLANDQSEQDEWRAPG